MWWMTLTNNRTPLLYYIKLCASFKSHGWIQTGVTVRKRSFLVTIGNFLSRVTLKFDGGPWKTIGQFSYADLSLVHHFIAIGEFKLEIQSGNAQFRSNLTIFLAVWPWNLKDDCKHGTIYGEYITLNSWIFNSSIQLVTAKVWWNYTNIVCENIDSKS